MVVARALVSGSLAAVVSTAMVSFWSRRVCGSIPAGTDASSQWVWGRGARRVRDWSWRHTALGYAIHHASALFWAVGYEAWQQRRPARPLRRAAAIAALAYVVDYHVVPARLSPGFERRVSTPGMACIYAGFAVGLALTTLLRARRHRSGPARVPGRAVLEQPRQDAQRQRR